MKKENLDQISFNLITVRSHEQVAQAIKRIRNLYGYSQTDLAKKTGLTQATVSRAENKSQKVEIRTLILILSALNSDLVIAPRIKNSSSSLEGLF